MAAPDPRAGMSCPTCAAPARRGQLVCLECGSRIALTYRRPPSWKLPAAIVGAVTLLALVGAILVYEALDDDAQQEVAGASLEPKRDPAAGAETEREGTETDRTETERTETERMDERPRTTQRKTPAPSGGPLVKQGSLYRWPKDLTGFTVVVLSAEDRPTATAFARRVAEARAAKAGVIRSDDFRTLPSGFFVVFAGYYRTQARADRAAARLGRRYPGAFPQRVSR